MVVWNFSSGHRVFSSTSVLPPASSTSRDAHGSGSQAPSISPDLNRSRVCAFSWLTMSTSLPPVVCTFNPLSSSHLRSATSWVPPSCGVARVLPFRSAAPLISA